MKNLKKLALLVLTLAVLLVCFTSCDKLADMPWFLNLVDKLPGNHPHTFSEATCLEPRTCECGATLGDPLGHDMAPDEALAPTCTETGYPAGETCQRCGHMSERETIPANGHSYASVVTEPTCTEGGFTTFTCTVCNDTYVGNKRPANGHDYTVEGNDATCTEPGYLVYTCHCGDTYTEEPAAKGHSYDKVVDEPTCTEEGLATYTCHCGDTYTEVLAAKGHNHEAVVTEPTCTEVGFTTYTCACGDSYVADEVAALGHTYESVVTEPTCTEAGLATFTCHCGDTYTEVLDAKGHKFIDGVCVCGEGYVAPEAPEATGEWTLVTELKTGDQVLIGAPAYGKLLSMVKTGYYNVGVDYSSDNFNNVTDSEIFVVTVNADGSYTFTSLSGKVLALADSYTSLNDTGANKSWTLETVSSGVFKVKNVARSLYLEWYSQYNNWSTHTSAGDAQFEISFYARATVVDENHVHNYISENVAPTCTVAGYTSYTCACGDSFTEEGEAATGHSYEAAVTAPTCTEAGFTTYACACGDSYTADEVAALGHTFVEGKCECGETDSSYVPPFGGGAADFGTIVLPSTKPTGDSSYTNTYTTADGWVTTNSAIQCGGTTDMNPQYIVIGPDTTYKAVCLNGKTSAPGKITSPVLVDGLSKLTVNFTKIFTDTELSVTVTVTEISTGNVYTYVIARSLEKNEKYQVYTEVWTLDVPVIGDFTIEIVNNCPTNQNSNKDRMTILSIEWEGAAPAHEHDYTVTTTATCTTEGVNTYTCECGDTYTEETDKLGHVDANLDVDCDREGCTGKVAPAADSLLSNFTANNLGSKLSTSGSYYVEGTIVEVLDAKNGIFLLDDGTGETFYFRLPKDADGVSHANWTVKLVLGDKVRLYGKINKFSVNSAPNGQFWPAMQSPVVTMLEQHPHVFGEPTCLLPGYCECGQDGPVALGHTDTDANDFCDVCEFNLKLDVETITTKYNDVKDTDKADTTNGVVTFDGVNFTATFSKDTAALNTNGTDHMRLNKGNKLTVTSNNGKNIVGITLVAVSSSYVDELELYCQALGYEYTVDGNEVTFEVEACTVLELANTSNKAQRIAAVKVIYEK